MAQSRKSRDRNFLADGWSRDEAIFFKTGYVELAISMEWNLGILEMLAGPEKVHAVLEKSLHQTLANWQLRAQ